MKDLIVLVPDKNIKFGLEALLRRTQSLKIRPIEFDIFIHPERDPGIYNDAHNFLRGFIDKYKYSIIFMDYEGCGQETKNVVELHNEVKSNLEKNGWKNRCEVIVLNPEVEVWLWVDSHHFYSFFDFNDYEELKEFLMKNGKWGRKQNKPDKPKEAFEYLLWIKRIPRSSSLYKSFAEKINFDKCSLDSFISFKAIIKNWFND